MAQLFSLGGFASRHIFMSIFSKIGEKVGEKLLGSVIADFGTLPANQKGWTVSIALRKQSSGYPNLVFKWKCGGNTTWETLEASPETLDKLASILHESRRHIDRPAA